MRELDTERLREWERSHLTLPQLRVLFQVRRTPGIRTGELARVMGITVSTTSGLVIKLADRGLIRRETVVGDRRQAPLYLTDEAQAVVSEIAETSRSFVARVGDELGASLARVTWALEQLGETAARVRGTEVRPDDTGEPVSPAVGSR